MNKLILRVLILLILTINNSIGEENIMILKLKNGDVKIKLFSDVAPNHVKRIKIRDNFVTTSKYKFILTKDLIYPQKAI